MGWLSNYNNYGPRVGCLSNYNNYGPRVGWLSNYNKTPVSKEGRYGIYQFIVTALVLADPFPDKYLNPDPDTDRDPDHKKMFKNLLEI